MPCHYAPKVKKREKGQEKNRKIPKDQPTAILGFPKPEIKITDEKEKTQTSKTTRNTDRDGYGMGVRTAPTHADHKGHSAV